MFPAAPIALAGLRELALEAGSVVAAGEEQNGTMRQSRGDLQELGTSGGESMSKNYAGGLCEKMLGTKGRGLLLCSRWLMGPVHISDRGSKSHSWMQSFRNI